MNLDESLKCIKISKAKFSEGDFEGAVKMAIKAQRMCETTETTEWLEKVKTCLNENNKKATETEDKKFNSQSEIETENKTKTQTQSKTKSDENLNVKSSTEGIRQRNINVSNNEKETNVNSSFSKEQIKEVKDFLSIKKDDYYAVLGVEKSSSQEELKKAYKKLALKFHPDKNQVPGAVDAFKTLSVAFSVLGDEEKRKNYDRYGSNVNNNISSSSNNFNGASFNGAEVSPEDLFNMFFQSAFQQQSNPFASFTNQGHGHGHGQHGQFFFSSNLNSFRTQHQQHQQRRHFRPESENEDLLRKFYQFAPLLIIFVLSLLSSWLFPASDEYSNYTSNSSIDHLVSLKPTSSNKYLRNTQFKRVPYYASRKFQKYFDKIDENENKKSSRLFRELEAYEQIIENNLYKELRKKCDIEEKELIKELKKAKDDDKKNEIKSKFKLNSCETFSKYFK